MITKMFGNLPIYIARDENKYFKYIKLNKYLTFPHNEFIYPLPLSITKEIRKVGIYFKWKKLD